MTKKLIEALIDLHNSASAAQGDSHLYASLQHAAEVIGEAQREEKLPPALKAAARINAGVYTYEVLETAAAELARLHPFEAAHQAWSDKTDWLQDGATPAELGVHRADVLRHRIEQLTKERDAALAVGDANARSGASWAAGVRDLQARVALLEARAKCQRMGLHRIAEPGESEDGDAERIAAAIEKLDYTNADVTDAAAHLRRLLAEKSGLNAQLEAVGAGGVESLRKPPTIADLVAACHLQPADGDKVFFDAGYVVTPIDGDGRVVGYRAANEAGLIAERIASLQDAVVREQLLAAGWTPPGDSTPQQPLAVDVNGVVRFAKNRAVTDLLNYASVRGLGMNDINMRAASGEYTEAEMAQLLQLLGMSVSEYGDWPCVMAADRERLDAMAAALLQKGGKK